MPPPTNRPTHLHLWQRVVVHHGVQAVARGAKDGAVQSATANVSGGGELVWRQGGVVVQQAVHGAVEAVCTSAEGRG
jgi:hypothetical protein